MSIDDALERLERGIGKRIERLTRRKASPREAIQIAEDVLDEVALQVEPTAGEARTFPYGRVFVKIAVPEGRAAAARAVLAHAPDLRARVEERLLAAGCAPAEARPELVLEVLEGVPPPTWNGRDFELGYGPSRRRKPAPEPPAAPPAVRLQVLEGSTGERRTHTLQLETIRIGRTASVADRARRTRRENDLVFDEEGAANATVSRTHAHLQWSADEQVFRLHDDGSTQGTHVLRDGRTLEVPGTGGRGVAVRSGDVLVLGRARVRFTVP